MKFRYSDDMQKAAKYENIIRDSIVSYLGIHKYYWDINLNIPKANSVQYDEFEVGRKSQTPITNKYTINVDSTSTVVLCETLALQLKPLLPLL